MDDIDHNLREFFNYLHFSSLQLFSFKTYTKMIGKPLQSQATYLVNVEILIRIFRIF